MSNLPTHPGGTPQIVQRHCTRREHAAHCHRSSVPCPAADARQTGCHPSGVDHQKDAGSSAARSRCSATDSAQQTSCAAQARVVRHSHGRDAGRRFCHHDNSRRPSRRRVGTDRNRGSCGYVRFGHCRGDDLKGIYRFTGKQQSCASHAMRNQVKISPGTHIRLASICFSPKKCGSHKQSLSLSIWTNILSPLLQTGLLQNTEPNEKRYKQLLGKSKNFKWR